MNFVTWLDAFVNPVLWTISNVFLFYTAVVMTAFVLLYRQFKWEKYPASRSIMYFTQSLLGVIFLVVIGIVTAPRDFWEYPPDTLWWRPALRTAIYLGVAITTTNLLADLWRRYRHGQSFGEAVDPRTLPKVRR